MAQPQRQFQPQVAPLPIPPSEDPSFQLVNGDERLFFRSLLETLKIAVSDPEKSDVLEDVAANLYPNFKVEGSSRPLLGLFMLHHHKGDIYDTSDTGTADRELIQRMEQHLLSPDTDDTTRPAILKFLSYWYGAFSLKAIDRFLDERQSVLLQWPVSAASLNDPNFVLYDGTMAVFLEWRLRIRLIRALHYPGLLKAQNNEAEINDDRMKNLIDTYTISRLLLERDHLITPADPNAQLEDEFEYNNQDPREPEMRWIKESRKVVQEMLEDVFVKAREPLGPAVADIDAREAGGEDINDFDRITANRELAPVQLLNLINKSMDEELASHPFERLVLDLLDKENMFEKLMSIEHVDDKLIMKQVSVLDEEDISRFPFRMDDLEKERRMGEQVAWRALQEVALVNRQRRNWRLLKDWQPGHRPWKKMYQLYDSSILETSWVADVIEQFLGRVTISLEDGNPRDTDHTHPSSYHSLAIQLFDILPIDLSGDAFRNSPGAEGFKDCYICRLPYTPQGKPIAELDQTHPEIEFHKIHNSTSPMAHTLMELHCTHIFHVGCIISYWDQYEEYTHTCPVCNKTAKLNWELAGLVPFEFISFDNGDGQDPIRRDIFAHNTYAHHAATLQFSVANQKLISKGLYDLPYDNKKNYKLVRSKNHTPRNLDDGSWLDRISAEYWATEHALAAVYEYEPIKWVEMEFEAGARATARDGFVPLMYQPSTNWRNNRGARMIPAELGLAGVGDAAGVENLSHVLGDRWMRSQYQPFPDQPNYNPDVYDIENVRILQESQRPPRQLAAELRRRRRIRDRLSRNRAAGGWYGTI